MTLEYLSPIEAKLAGATGEIEGYGSTFGNVDLGGDIVAPGAFAKSLAEHKAADSMPALLWGHNSDEPIGVWTDAREDHHGLKLRGRLLLETQRGAEARALAKAGALALSIGYRTRNATFEKGRRVIKDAQLFEVSLVAVPMNPAAKITSVKSAVDGGEITPKFVERLLRDAGLPKAFAKAILAGGWKAATADRCDADGAVQELAEALKRATASLETITKGMHR